MTGINSLSCGIVSRVNTNARYRNEVNIFLFFLVSNVLICQFVVVVLFLLHGSKSSTKPGQKKVLHKL